MARRSRTDRVAAPTRRPALLLLVFLTFPVLGGPAQGQDEPEQQGVLARVVSRLLTTPTSRVEVGRVEGVLSSTATIHGIRVFDEDGVWLSLGRAELDWSRAALLRGRLLVRELTLQDLEIARRPPPTPRPEGVAEGPLLPEVPVEIVVERFRLDDLSLGEPVLGEPMTLSAEGSARLGDPDEGLALDLEARRLDAEGALDVDLAYVPDTRRLTLDLRHEEPAGGVLARLLGIPGLPPVALALAGDAPLEDFAAELDFEAGPEIGADGSATVSRVDDGHRVDLDVDARIAGLLPEAAAPLFAGRTRLTGVAIAGEGVSVERLALETATASYTLTGTIAAEPGLDLTLAGETRPDLAEPIRIADTAIGRLALDLAVSGALTAPSLAGTLVAETVSGGFGDVGRLELAIGARPRADEPPAARWDFDVTATGEDVEAAAPLAASLVGSVARLSARGVVDAAGLADVSEARLETDAASAAYEGLLSRRTVEGLFEARIADLAALSGLDPWLTSGSAELTGEIVADPYAGTGRVRLDGGIDGFESGVAAIDALAGDVVRLAGAIAAREQGVEADALRLEGADVAIVLDGVAGVDTADLGLEARVPTLAALHDRITAGEALLTARLTGPSAGRSLTGEIAVRDLVALDQPVPELTLGVEIDDLAGAFDARVTMSGAVAGAPARGVARLMERDAGYVLDGLDVEIGSVGLQGAVTVDETFRSEGEVRLDAGDLSDLAPLVLADLGGTLEARIRLGLEDGGQSATFAVEGRDLRYEGIAAATVSVDGEGRTLFEAPQIDGIARAEDVSAFGETFDLVSVEAQATRAATEFDFEAVSGDVLYRTSGTLAPGDPVPRLDLRDISVGPAP